MRVTVTSSFVMPLLWLTLLLMNTVSFAMMVRRDALLVTVSVAASMGLATPVNMNEMNDVKKTATVMTEMTENNHQHDQSVSSSPCRLYLAPKVGQGLDRENPQRKFYAFYSGIAHEAYETPMKGTSLLDAIVMKLYGTNKNEFSPWHNYSWSSSVYFPTNHTNYTRQQDDLNYEMIITGGLGTMLACNDNRDQYSNVKAHVERYGSDDNDRHYEKKHTFLISTIRKIQVGEELFLDCSKTSWPEMYRLHQENNEDENHEDDDPDYPPVIVSMQYLEKGGLCVDTMDELEIRSILTSSSVDQVATEPKQEEDKESWLSSLSMDFDHLRQQPRLEKQQEERYGLFSKKLFHTGDVVTVSPVIYFDKSQMNIITRYYPEDTEYYDPTLPNFRTDDERNIIPIQYKASQVLGQYDMLNYCYGHPNSNILLLPFSRGVNYIRLSSPGKGQPNVSIRWSNHTIFNHIFFDDRERVIYRNVSSILESLPALDLLETSDIHLSIEYVALRDILPNDEIVLDYGVDYTNAYEQYYKNRQPQQQQQQPFRHEIGVPEGMYPQHWMRYQTNDATTSSNPESSDFIANPLKPGYITPVRWSDTQEIVTPWAFRIGVPKELREMLLQYCHTTGITELLEHVTKDGNSLEPDEDAYVTLPSLSQTTDYHQNETWYLQRPAANWRSNLHWLSPGNDQTHQTYLQILSASGFDNILQSIGEYFNMNGLAVYQVTFIGVSYATKGFLHTDFRHTQHKAYNIIVPLIIAEKHPDPELDIEEGIVGYDDEADLEDERLFKQRHIGRYRYEYDTGIMIGDYANHGTASVDYRYHHEMRLAATIYVADINEDNIDKIMHYFTQAYPPVDRKLMLSWSGIHWSKTNSTKSLPKLHPDHIMSSLVHSQQSSEQQELQEL